MDPDPSLDALTPFVCSGWFDARDGEQGRWLKSHLPRRTIYMLPELDSAIHKSRDYRQDYHHISQLEEAAVI